MESPGILCSNTCQKRKVYKIWSDKLKGRDNSKELGVEGRIILDFRKIGMEGVVSTHLGPVASSCEHGSELHNNRRGIY
jgi:hypothetical protein